MDSETKTPETPEQEPSPQAATTPEISVDELLSPITPVVEAQDASPEADETAETSTVPEEDAAKAVEEKVEESLSKKLNKKDKETMRLRKRAQETEAENQRLKALLAEQGLDVPVANEEDLEAAKIKLATRQEDGKDRYIEEHGEEAWNELFIKEDGPWQNLKRSATDEEAAIYQGRMQRARDPIQEAQVILKEHALFEKHGTRNVTELVALEVAAQTEEIKKSVLADLKAGRGLKPGKAVATLREATTVEDAPDRQPIPADPVVDDLLVWK